MAVCAFRLISTPQSGSSRWSVRMMPIHRSKVPHFYSTSSVPCKPVSSASAASIVLYSYVCRRFSLQSDREIFQYTHATFSTPSRLGRRSTAGDSAEPAEDSPGSDVFLTLPRNSTASAFDIARNSSTVTPTRLSLSNGDINDILDDHLDDKVDENPASDSQPVENSDPKSQSKSNK